jgi:cyclic pyranopterin monophosphate synthase
LKEFTHIDKKNNPCMVDISNKNETFRSAVAVSEIWLPEVVRKQFKEGDIQSKKGPVFTTAIIAGTMALKQTSSLIPFCHQLNIEGSKIEIDLKNEHAVIRCEVRTFGKTGVEMEALTGAQIAALTIYDMCKAFGHEMKIENCQLIEKLGGKSDFKN